MAKLDIDPIQHNHSKEALIFPEIRETGYDKDIAVGEINREENRHTKILMFVVFNYNMTVS